MFVTEEALVLIVILELRNITTLSSVLFTSVLFQFTEMQLVNVLDFR